MGVGLRLKEVLRNHKMTIKQLSEKTDISINTLYSITKRDSENIDPVILQRIIDALGITTDELLGIAPLPPQDVPLHEGSQEKVSLSSADQEFYAFNTYLESMGYRTVLEMGSDNPDCLWSIYDNRNGKKYYASTEMLEKLMHSVNSFAKFQIRTLIAECENQKAPDATNIQD